MPKKIKQRTNSITSSFQHHLNHLLKSILTIIKLIKINPVGATNEIKPNPQLYASITLARSIPTTLASGAIIGIDSTAKPDDDWMKKPKII